ncbi:MAG: hypothetical protein ABFD69_03210 [Candidatus Sumerlaeia bacterium]
MSLTTKTFVMVFVCIYMPAILVAVYYVSRWLLVAIAWHVRLAREKGWLAAVLNFFNPFRLPATIRAIMHEIPDAGLYFRRSLYWVCAVAVIGFIGVRIGTQLMN